MQGSLENVQQVKPDKSLEMTKRDQISFYKRQVKTSEELKEVAMQNYNLAARLETEARSALLELGAKEGQGRKVKYELPNDVKASLLGNLTASTNKKA